MGGDDAGAPRARAATRHNPLFLVGLTGGIGAGKSTVGRLLGEQGAVVIDADRLAREVVLPGSQVLAQIVEALGPDVVDAAGQLDRAAVARRVFKDPHQRKTLEAIMHPAIGQALARRMAALQRDGVTIAVYEAALLAETGRQAQMDCVIVVVADDDIRVRRLAERDGLLADDIVGRLAAQWPQQSKAAGADFIIDNSGTMEHTREQAIRVWQAMRCKALSERR